MEVDESQRTLSRAFWPDFSFYWKWKNVPFFLLCLCDFSFIYFYSFCCRGFFALHCLENVFSPCCIAAVSLEMCLCQCTACSCSPTSSTFCAFSKADVSFITGVWQRWVEWTSVCHFLMGLGSLQGVHNTPRHHRVAFSLSLSLSLSGGKDQ